MRRPLEVSRQSFYGNRVPWGPLLLALGLLHPGSTGLSGQTVLVERQESFRSAPGGTVLGELMPGAEVIVESRDGEWTEVTVEGFVWLSSMQIHEPGELDLIISEPGGENLRAEPQGARIGRFSQGTRLAELGRIPGWGQVRRTGWIPSGALGMEVGQERGPAATEEVTTEEATITIGRGGLPVLAAPGGRGLGRLEGGTPVQVIEREGDWLRVQVDGWVRAPEAIESRDGDGGPGGGVAEGVTVEAVQADPEGFLGRLVELELQVISVERAEALRTDFYEGEPFLLTRTDGEGGRHFVYVALAEERVDEFSGLQPLQRVRFQGRVRAPAAAITRNLLLDLVDAEILR
jgi:hypothetical protein